MIVETGGWPWLSQAARASAPVGQTHGTGRVPVVFQSKAANVDYGKGEATLPYR